MELETPSCEVRVFRDGKDVFVRLTFHTENEAIANEAVLSEPNGSALSWRVNHEGVS